VWAAAVTDRVLSMRAHMRRSYARKPGLPERSPAADKRSACGARLAHLAVTAMPSKKKFNSIQVCLSGTQAIVFAP